MPHIRVHVQRQAVQGDVPFHPYPHGADLGRWPGEHPPRSTIPGAPLDPHPRVPRIAPGRDSKYPQRLHHHLLQQTHISSDIQAEIRQAQNGIGHQLPRTMVGDVPAAVGGLHINAQPGQNLGWGDQVFGRSWAAADGDDRIVLHQDQRRRKPAFHHRRVRLQLYRPGRHIGQPAQVFDLKRKLLPGGRGDGGVVTHEETVIIARFGKGTFVATIHPTAVVDPQAQLAQDVQIGPGCIIEGPVTIGPGTRLLGQVWLKGPLTLGARNVLYPHAALGLEPQDRKFDPAHAGSGTQIGDDNIIREGMTIHRATGPHPTTVGNGCYLMVNSHIAHDCVVGNGVTLVNGALIAGHVEVGDGVILSGNTVVHQFCRVGRLAMMAGTMGITKDLPPFCVVYHTRRVSLLNLVGLRRAGQRAHIDGMRRAFDIFYREGLPNSAALDRMDKELGDNPLCAEFVRFIRASKRGITPYADSDMNDA